MKSLFWSLLATLVAVSTLSGSSLLAQEATPAKDIVLPEGFKAELLYTVPGKDQGSWVSLTHDDKGRLIASDQYGKLYRVTLSGPTRSKPQVEQLKANIGMAQGLLYAFDSLYVVVNGKAPEGPGLYRLQDTTGDDQFDKMTLLRKMPGGSEHGPHAVIKGADGKSICICGGNRTDLPVPEPDIYRVPKTWKEDHLLGRMPDARGHNAGRLAPGGWIAKLDPDGKNLELIATGFRNEYDIAFNPEGELFTYDADMEWDIGAPWYRPTRVNHVTSGSEFGWRNGTGKWPAYYADSRGAAVNIGPGSPTGIVFGTGTKFPAKYQRALFIADWSFGQVHAVHLEPNGASYKGTFEKFMSAAPLPVTDMIVHPGDGNLYFTIGGRRVQSALYRVSYVGKESTAPAAPQTDDFAAVRKTRRELETLHLPTAGADAVEKAWPYLSHADRDLRYAARIAIEHQPAAKWRDKAYAETNDRARVAAMIALARSADSGSQEAMIKALSTTKWNGTVQDKLALLRAYALAFTRLGEPSAESRKMVLDHLNDLYPAANSKVNRELCQVLVYLNAPKVVDRTVALLEKAPTQEEQIHYAFCLRNVKEGWTPELRERYFSYFPEAGIHRGGASFRGFLQNIRKKAVATLTKAEAAKLGDLTSKPIDPPKADQALEERDFVKAWTVDELLPLASAPQSGRNFENGKQLFGAVGCFKCHRFDNEGGAVGPVLTGAGARFNAKDLLEAIVEPNKTISSQYAATMFVTSEGEIVTGRIANLSGDTLRIVTNMLDPGNFTNLKRGDIEEQRPSDVSMMPSGLLNTLTKEEVLDLLAYLRSGGNPEHAYFKK